jgi:hypothetical protein
VLWLSQLVVVMPVAIASMVIASRIYLTVTGLESTDPLRPLHVLLFSVSLIGSLILGGVVGGWIWVLVGRALFSLSRAEVEKTLFLATGESFIAKYNQWCLNVLFGHRTG